MSKQSERGAANEIGGNSGGLPIRLPFAIPELGLYFSMLLFYVGIVLRLGGIIFFGVGVAAVIFQIAPSKDIAGELNAVFLSRLNVIELVATAMYSAGALLYFLRKKTRAAAIPVVLAIASGAFLWWYGVVLSGEIEALRGQITSFQTPAAADAPLLEQFQVLHKRYSSAVGISTGIIFMMMMWQTFLYALDMRIAQAATSKN